MKTLEFETVNQNDIFLQPIKKPRKPLRFNAFRIDTRGFKFDREEAHERFPKGGAGR
ncbi:hypothetical protein AGMMS50276_18190 [Synergistales bacterium]|nr:hypothetical protein AGMMS50276_18190 [Synergistales bacterium]